MKLEYATYADARQHFTYNERWEVFDGHREHFNIAHECVDRHPPEAEAIRLQFADGRREVYTFRELARRSSQFAHLLAARGINPGDKVAVVLNPSLEFYASFFGILKRGAVVVPCSALFGPEAIALRVKDAEARAVVTNREKAAIIDRSLVQEILIAEELPELLDQQLDSYTPHPTTADTLAVIQFSSGTTGTPKPVSYRHIAATLTAVNMKLGIGLQKDDRYYCPSSPAWGHGIWYGTVGPLIFGNAIGAYSGKFDAGILLEALEAFQITNLCATPLVFSSLIKTGKLSRERLRLRQMSYTGGPLDKDTLIQYKETLGIFPRSTYGSTEVGVAILHYPFSDYQIKLGSLGKPMLGVKVAVIDEAGNELPPGQEGQIAIWRRDGWVRVGDAAIMDEEGYFWYRGRLDDVIISAGYTIGAFEVERAIAKHPAVAKVAVVGSPDQERGEIVKAFIVPHPGYQPGEELAREIQNFVRERLSQHEYPREVEFVDSLPETLDGKIKRKELREQEKKRKGVA